jgi:predicted membrane protein
MMTLAALLNFAMLVFLDVALFICVYNEQQAVQFNNIVLQLLIYKITFLRS